jgi:hypothetical protein
MKIYTEVVYTWDDNKGELVEESSKSFDYEGEVTQCHRKRFWHSHWKPPPPPKIVLPKIKIDIPPIKPPTIDLPNPVEVATNIVTAATDVGKDVGKAVATTGANLRNELGAATTTLKNNTIGLGEDIKGGIKYYKDKIMKQGEDAVNMFSDKVGAGPGSKAKPGEGTTMGQGGQEGMKGATMVFTKKSTIGSGGKRRLTKIKKKGSSGARV